MNIYPSLKTLPYVYICENVETKEFYFGVRIANKVPSSEDLGNKYFTSSSRVKPIFHKFSYKVLAEFFKPEDAYIFEQFLIEENWKNPLLLNKAVQGKTLKFNWFNNISDEDYSRWIEKLSKRKLGVKKSEEHKKKQSEVRIGKKRGNYNRTKQNPKCSCINCGLLVSNCNLKHHYIKCSANRHIAALSTFL